MLPRLQLERFFRFWRCHDKSFLQKSLYNGRGTLR
jgi:hypothetical protein